MTDAPSPAQRAPNGRLPPLPADVLAGVGRALYGDQWAAPLARALGVGLRTVERWKAGEARITPFIAPDLERLMKDRVGDIGQLRIALQPHVKAARDGRPAAPG